MEPILILAEFGLIVYLAVEIRKMKRLVPKLDKTGKFAPKVK